MVKAPLLIRRYVLKCCWRTTSLSYISAINILNMLKFLYCSIMITAVIALFFPLQGSLRKIIHLSLIFTFFSTIPSYNSEPYLHYFLIPVFSFQSYSDRKPVQRRLQKVSLQQKVCFHLIYIFKQKIPISKLVINEGTRLQFLKINNQTKLISPVTYISDCQRLGSWYFFKTKSEIAW